MNAIVNDIPQQTTNGQKVIHPIIIYPFSHPEDTSDLKQLYEFISTDIIGKPEYCRPITVLNRQTYYRNYKKLPFNDFLDKYVRKFSEIIDTWSVDTCQMWLSGFGYAFDRHSSVNDVYWLIPGDFNYGKKPDVMRKLPEIARKVYNTPTQVCLGEITVAPNSSKQLIDTYGTYGLLYNWFPDKATVIRNITDKPRSEFFAIEHQYLYHLLCQRWYAYEQTLIILLEGISGGQPIINFDKIKLGDISDLSQGRENLAAAMQQVERTERVLKQYWREKNEKISRIWSSRFRELDNQSERIRAAALVILENLLTY